MTDSIQGKPKGKRGGARAGAGRPRVDKAKIGDKAFAERVLARIGKPDWMIPNLTDVKSAEDYAIWMLSTTKGGDVFDKLLDRRDGLPMRTVNHLHDKPIEMNVTVSLSETIQKARQRAAK